MDYKSTNNHFVPRHYLKNFSCDLEIREDGKKEYFIYSYERGTEPIRKNIREIASQKDLYIFDDAETGEKSDEIEKLFRYMENKAAPILDKKLIEKQDIKYLSDRQRADLSEFFSFLSTRTPAFANKMAGFEIENKKTLIENTLQFDQFLKTNNLEKKDFFKDVDIKMTNANEYFLGFALELGLGLVNFFYDKNWHLLISRKDRAFITSDHPVQLIKRRGVPYGGFACSAIFIPISPSHCLMLDDKARSKEVIFVSEKTVAKINRCAMFFSDENIYSKYSSKTTSRIYDATVKGEGQKTDITQFGPYIISTDPQPDMFIEDIC